jgi:hypothetical protein
MVAQLVTPPQLLSRDLWDLEGRAWKSLQALQMTYHATNRNKKQIIVASIPWSPANYTNCFQARDWINKRIFENNTALAWVYHVTGVTPTGLIRVANSQVITLSPQGYHPIRVLSQERHRAPLRVAKKFYHSPSPPYSGFSNPVSLMGFPGTRGNGTGKPPPNG